MIFAPRDSIYLTFEDQTFDKFDQDKNQIRATNRKKTSKILAKNVDLQNYEPSGALDSTFFKNGLADTAADLV